MVPMDKKLMKKALLSGIAALFLATGTAHADCFHGPEATGQFCSCLKRTVVSLRGSAIHKRMEQHGARYHTPYAPMTNTLLRACYRYRRG